MALGNAAFWPLEAANGVLVQTARLASRNIRTTVVVSLILICGSFAAAAALQMRFDRMHALNQATLLRDPARRATSPQSPARLSIVWPVSVARSPTAAP